MAKSKLSGPDAWYQGCPNLIYYSKYFGNKRQIKMKELIERRNQLDEQILNKIEIIEALKKSVELIKSTPGFSAKIRDIFDKNIERQNGKLQDSRYEWNIVDGACNEMERKNKHV